MLTRQSSCVTARGIPPAPPAFFQKKKKIPKKNFKKKKFKRKKNFKKKNFKKKISKKGFKKKKIQKKKNFKKKFFLGGGPPGPPPPLWTDTQSENITFARFAKRAVINRNLEQLSNLWYLCEFYDYLVQLQKVLGKTEHKL